MEKTSPFAGQVPTGGLVIGAPFAISELSIPVNAKFTCHCAVPYSELLIVNSTPVKCPACQKTYVVAFNPANQQIMVAMAQDDPPQVPS